MVKKLLTTLSTLFIASFVSLAQYTVEFSADITGGCSPLIVSFTNLSDHPTGATYLWRFGNGNTSTAKNPQATYSEPGAYTVTLEVTYGGTTDILTKTDYITGYSKPNVDFSISDNGEGCVPLALSFNALPASGVTIDEFNWSFGDGNVSNAAAPVHTYQIQGTFTTTLVIKDTNGCIGSMTKVDSVHAFQPTAKFGADKTYGCSGELLVAFNNLSSSQLPITNFWRFGDGNTSALNNPNHTYTGKGVYTPTLIVTDSYGCKDSIEAKNLIRIDQVKASFALSHDTLCPQQTLKFTNTSIDASSYLWKFGDGTQSTASSPEKKYAAAGDYAITLTAKRSSCQDDITLTVNIEHVLADFLPTDTFLCQTEIDLAYSNTSVNAVSYDWRFGNGQTSNVANPTINYPLTDELKKFFEASYSDTLIATSKHGCTHKKVAINNVKIVIPNVKITSSQLTSGCAPLTIPLTGSASYNTTKDQINQSYWTVNGETVMDGTSYQHTQTSIGNQEVLYHVTTDRGCMHIAKTTVSAGEKLTPNFSIAPAGPICASETVILTGTVAEPDKVYSVTWDLGDGSSILPADIIPHQFQDTGSMTITFGVRHYGCISEITKENAIYVNGPYVDANISFDCANPLQYSFSGTIKGADNYTWDFGDGSPLVSNVKNPVHNYSGRGNYMVSLTGTNSSNTCSYTRYIAASPRNVQAEFKMDYPKRCINTDFKLDGYVSTDHVPFMHNGSKRKYLYIIDDKEFFTDTTLTHLFKTKGEHIIKLIVEDENQCRDTVQQTVKIFNPEVAFSTNYKLGCMPVTFTFTDQTLSDTTLTNWLWTFGDGNSSTTQSPDHSYMAFGKYNVKLVATDAEGCAASLEKKEDILAIFPDPSFKANDTTTCTNTSITLSENTESQIISFEWSLNGSVFSTEASPSIAFADSGYYDIGLAIVDVHGCAADTVKSKYIHVQRPPVADFTSSTTSSNCYPFLVNFYDASVTDYPKSWFWIFDEGNNKSVLQNPSFIYSKPGLYDVTMVSTSTYGCADTITKQDYIEVKGPYAVPVIADTVCTHSPALVWASDTADIFEMAWDLGDGTISFEPEIEHTYLTPGTKYPSLILKSDDKGTCNILVKDTVYILDFQPNFDLTLDPFSGCIPLTTSLEQRAINNTGLQWIVNGVLESTSNDSTYLLTEPGQHSIELQITNSNYACIATSEPQLFEAFAPPIITTKNDTLICRYDDMLLWANGGIMYQWTPAEGLDDPSIDAPIASPEKTTRYQVLVTDIHECSATDSVLIEVQQEPIVAVPDTTIIIGEIVSVTIPETGLQSIRWEDTPGIGCLNCYTNTFQPLETTKQTAYLTDINGCFTVPNSFTITVERKYSVDVPSAFTPNGDGINDELFIKGWGLKELIEFRVFNRFGELVYESNDLQQGWDGKYKGQILPTETYMYVIKALTYNNETLSKSGSIKILR